MADVLLQGLQNVGKTPTFTPQPTAPIAPVQTQAPQAPQPTQGIGQTGSGLDPKIVTLAKAIRQVESGGNPQAKGASGEHGLYQFMPDTWNGNAPRFGVNVPLEQATPEQQNQVAYKQLAEWATQHPDWNVGNFASAWNAGPGKPNAYVEGNAGTNSQGVKYDTAAYAKMVAEQYQQFKQQTPQDGVVSPMRPTGPTNAITGDEFNPSLGGFAGNVVKSGANFIGNTADALLHPIRTVQDLGGTAVGALQELGGQENENTAKFDALKNYFVQKYGGVENIERSLYQDPISVLSDLSTIFAGGAGAAGAIGKLGTLAKAGEVADIAGTVGNTLSKASDFTNPLTPLAKGLTLATTPIQKAATYGVSKAMGVGEDTARIVQENKAAITSEAIRNADFTRIEVAKQVENAFQAKEAEFGDTGKAYEPIKQAGKVPEGYDNIKNVPPSNAIPVASNFLEEQFRKVGNLEVKDGKILPTTTSKLGKAELSKLQDVLDTFKPTFQKGYISPEEYLTLRTRLAKAAFNDSGIKDAEVAKIAAGVRANLNTEYRSLIPGLEKVDNEYSQQATEIKDLRKGIFDKEGNLLPAAINKIANAGGKGKDLLLEKLERILPGITKKIQIQKALEDIAAHDKPRVGTYTESALKAGGLLAGLSTGNIGLIAGSIALAIVGSPNIAVPLLKAFDFEKRLVAGVTEKLSKYVLLGSENSKIQTASQSQDQQDTETQTPVSPPTNYPSFDFESATKAGYTPTEIEDFLKTI